MQKQFTIAIALLCAFAEVNANENIEKKLNDLAFFDEEFSNKTSSESTSISESPSTNSLSYLCWDNCTPASYEDLLADPLLIIRTSYRFTDHRDCLSLAWQRVAQFDFLNAKDNSISSTPVHFNTPNILKNASATNHFNIIPPSVVNVEHHFDHITPSFHINDSNNKYEKMWWQIASNSDFTNIISTFDAVQEFHNTLILSNLDETFLNPNQTYFFRAKGFAQETWSDWSASFPFTVNQPLPVENVRIEKGYQDSLELKWDASGNQEIKYCVFGSNSQDFIPSIYSSVQADALLGTTLISASTADNYLGETSNPSWPIDSRFAYYRVIAKAQNHFSRPSPLINVSENTCCPTRDILQLDPLSDVYTLDPSQQLIRRVPFPSSYPWMQMRSVNSHGNDYKYIKNPYVSEEIWNELQPYFLPENHPAKTVLDRIFKHRILESRTAMRKAGFGILRHPQNEMIIAKHPRLKGYLIKAYLDNKEIKEYYWWKRRIDGVRQVQNCIDRHRYNSIMKTPKKWVYPLPPEPSPKSENVSRKNFILIVEDMHILTRKKNRSAYKKKMTPALLHALYIVLTENLLIDSIYASNIPFCHDGKIAFLDTEHFNNDKRPFELWKIAQYLSPDMHAYWDQLIHQK